MCKPSRSKSSDRILARQGIVSYRNVLSCPKLCSFLACAMCFVNNTYSLSSDSTFGQQSERFIKREPSCGAVSSRYRHEAMRSAVRREKRVELSDCWNGNRCTSLAEAKV